MSVDIPIAAGDRLDTVVGQEAPVLRDLGEDTNLELSPEEAARLEKADKILEKRPTPTEPANPVRPYPAEKKRGTGKGSQGSPEGREAGRRRASFYAKVPAFNRLDVLE